MRLLASIGSDSVTLSVRFRRNVVEEIDGAVTVTSYRVAGVTWNCTEEFCAVCVALVSCDHKFLSTFSMNSNINFIDLDVITIWHESK